MDKKSSQNSEMTYVYRTFLSVSCKNSGNIGLLESKSKIGHFGLESTSIQLWFSSQKSGNM